MKIAYVAHHNVFRPDGVSRKISEQMRFWKREAEVRLFVLSPSTDLSGKRPALEAEVFGFATLGQRLRAICALVDAVIAEKPDVIYFRYDPPYPPLAKLFRRFPTVVELNTDDLGEYRLGSPARFWFNRLTRGRVFRAAVGLVSVSHEIARLPHIRRFRKPTEVIGNGIDLSQFPSPVPPATNTRPRMVFMGTSLASWYGIDKVLSLSRHLPEFDFDIIGVDKDQLPKAPTQNVTAHGFVDKSKYAAILRTANVGIGTLALHRKDMNEASALKIREYLAFGLPVILGNRDTDFLAGAPFLLELPNCEDNVQTHLSEIRNFVARMGNKRVSREEVAPHIDAGDKETKRMRFVKSLI